MSISPEVETRVLLLLVVVTPDSLLPPDPVPLDARVKVCLPGEIYIW
jgi:hypothetical protein